MPITVSNESFEAKQRWREALLILLRVLMGCFLVLLMLAVMQWPFEGALSRVERCFNQPELMMGVPGRERSAEASMGMLQECVRAQVAFQAAEAERVRRDVAALVALLIMTVTAAFLVRTGLRAQLQQQLSFSEQLIDAIPLPLSLRSTEGHFIRVNKAFEERHLFLQDELRGKPVEQFFPQNAHRIQALDDRAKESHGPVEEEFDVSTPGQPRHVLVRVQALRLADGQVAGIVGVQTDITSIRVKEAELTHTNEKLRQLSVQMIHAQEDERRRIARDLHDQVGQILTALKLQLGSLGKKGSIANPQEAVMMPVELAEEALRSTRDLSASLHPHLLDDLGLQAAIGWLIERFIRPSVASIELRCRIEPPRGPQPIELVAFRVVQEALTNVVRHANASRVGVIVETTGESLSIEVIDDGVGIAGGTEAIEAKRATSLGMVGMNDRVTEAGGELGVESTPGVGTCVRVKLPWKSTAAAAPAHPAPLAA